ncbi:Protein EVI2A [Mesitornis unicolor]|uniref:Protein EVI2A n=1 Tax=Mesitornis unicolor TaxID=54374 RepID=A0A091QKV6_9AVES|nr:PREDICTED: protein EVI2A [Mesitornis unicolor]KFQ28190.1 Protein EVI2A [Mesitornis unicolor]
METERRSKPRPAFPVLIIFSLCLQTSANHTDYPRVRNDTWHPMGQTVTEANTNPPLSTNFSSRTAAFERQTSTLRSSSSTTAQNSTSPPAPRAPSAPAGPGNSSNPKSTTIKEPCEDNKSLLLICFVIIAVLVLTCAFLFLSTVVIANKMSYLKKTKQGKRRPRSNGDILATNSLWPTAAGTWQRMPAETAGTELLVQELRAGRDAAVQGRHGDETTEKLPKETRQEQESREPKSHKPVLTNFVVEI